MQLGTIAIIRKLRPNHQHDFFMFYAALILLSFHWAVVTYINSSFLEQFMSPTLVSLLYVLGALFLLLIFFWSPYLLRKIGNFKFTVFFTVCEIIALIGLGLSHSFFPAVLFFLMHFISVPLILFGLDVLIEHLIGSQEKQTGSKRGLYLSLSNFAFAIAPLLLGSILAVDGSNFSYVYFTSIIFILPFCLILFLYFKQFQDPDYEMLSIRTMTEILSASKDNRNIVIVSIYLQMFFTWTYIYMPLYLAKIVGFSWYEIGLIMFVGLSAYVIFEYPIGVIADRLIGEKEMMATGFLLISLSLSWFAFLEHADIAIWMLAMFLTRTGASLVESTSESYFFKRAGSIDVHKISLFRMTHPLGSVFGALIGSIVLIYLPFNLLFIALALVLVQGLFFTIRLHDTR